MSQVPLYWHYLSHSHVLVDIGASRGCCPRGVVFFMSEVPLYKGLFEPFTCSWRYWSVQGVLVLARLNACSATC